MKELILKYFTYYETGLEYQDANPDMLPIKTSILLEQDGSKFMNVLSGVLFDHAVSKTVYVDEKRRILDASIYVRDLENDKTSIVNASFLTLLRSALSAAYCVYKKYARKYDIPICFIGGGRINLLTARILKELGYTEFYLIGGRSSRYKNHEMFEQFTTCDFKGDGRLSKVVIACTTNSERERLYTRTVFPSADLIICQDGGFTLDDTFRTDSFIILSDYALQLKEHYFEEFPFDCKMREVESLSIHNLSGNRLSIYLYGTVVADFCGWVLLDKYPNIISNLKKEFEMLFE